MQEETLKELRLKTGRTLQQVADACGRGTSTIYRWEDKGDFPNARALADYADALGVSVADVERVIGPRVVRSDEDLDLWISVVAQADIEPTLRVFVIGTYLFLDDKLWVAFVTPDELAERCNLDAASVRTRWREMLATPYLEEKSGSALALTLPRSD